MVLLRKTKSPRPRFKSRGVSLEIRCKANILPLKSLMYAIAHASKYVVKPKNSNASLYVHGLSVHMRRIMAMAGTLTGSNSINPDSHSDSIESAISAYVNLFYAISKEERKEFIDMFSRNTNTKIKPEKNLLLLPAIMADINLLSKEEVSKWLFYSLYMMPLKVMYESSKSALRVVLLERNMAIRTFPYETMEHFSTLMSGLEARMGEIKNGVIKPQEDEDLKAEFIERATEFSQATEINIMDLLSEKVGTESAVRTRMHRIMRRSRY